MNRKQISTNIILITIFLLTGLNQWTFAQSGTALAVGDMLPDFVIPKVIHSANRRIRTSDFKEKLLILDFWGTSCGTCIEALPHMEALQTHFGSQIMILPVTNEPEKHILEFWRRNRYVKNLKLPSVVEDKKFHGYFPHITVPHEIWIYKGKVIGITGHEYVDTRNIAAVLKGEKVNLALKYDFYKFNPEKPIFTTNSKQIDLSNTRLSYSAICGYIPSADADGLVGTFDIYRDTINKTVRCYSLNRSIYNTYMLSLVASHHGKQLIPYESFHYAPNHVIWEVADRSRYRYNKSDGYLQDWKIANAICFESLHSDTGQTDLQVHQSSIVELNRMFGLSVRWQRQKEKVFVIRKKGKRQFGKVQPGKGIIIFELINKLNEQEDQPYVFDETGELSEQRDYLNSDILNHLNDMPRQLKKYGLEFASEERLVDKVVFTELKDRYLIDAKQERQAKNRRYLQKDMAHASAKENSSFLEANSVKPGVITLPSGLQYKIIKNGDGQIAGIDDTISVNYTGMEVNGRIFDSSEELGNSALLVVNEVIEGWKSVLKFMPTGAKWILYIPASLAYGEHTGRGSFPPNSTLIFELELLKIIRKQQ